MWGLEYGLLFGLPNNKLELAQGRTRLAYPFRSREQAQSHLNDWLETLCRWKGVSSIPSIAHEGKWRTATTAGFALRLAPRPIEVYVPFDFETFLAVDQSFWRRDLWEKQPVGKETGWDNAFQPSDIKLKLWTLLGNLCKKRGGLNIGGVDIAMSETAAVAPDQFVFLRKRSECLIKNDYFQGLPDLIVEILTPASRAIDRGARKELYRRSGVPHLWLVDPELETVEVYAFLNREYRAAGTYVPGHVIEPAIFPGEQIDVSAIFDTQWKHWGQERKSKEEAPEPVPNWLFKPDLRMGLEYLLVLGHPDRRYEIWGNRAPCVLAFGSSEEAKARHAYFLEEAARWEGIAPIAAAAMSSDTDQAEIGRFRFARCGRHVKLDVAVDAKKYKELLDVSANHKNWDWGEERDEPADEDD